MTAPRSLQEMIEASRLDPIKAAIVETLDRQLGGVTVKAHPGKLDINDVVAKAVVAAPGVAVGWSRARCERHIDGRLQHTLDFVAFVATQDMSIEKKRVARDIVAHAIGTAILDILENPELHHFGVEHLERPAAEPAPEFKPVFTAQSWTDGVAYYAVTWSQTLWSKASPLFGPRAPVSFDPETAEVSVGDGELPPELQAIAGRFFRGEDI